MFDKQHQINTITSGAVDILPIKDLEQKLDEGRALNIKLGIDPTSPDIHLGHAVALNKLRQFQELGHNIILVIGDGTALIGDPTGRNSTRPQLTSEEIERNAQTYISQAFQILVPDKTKIVHNADWILSLDMKQLLSLMANFTVARILDREDFHNRYTNGTPISVHEFMYPIMQAYDSVVIEADVEIGGTDQLFNLFAGRELMEKMNIKPQVCITMPLLEGTDGIRKMSKTYGNYIALNDSANNMFGKVMSIPDTLMPNYFRLCSSFPVDKIEEIEQGLTDGSLHPNKIKRVLAHNITEMYHGENAADEAEKHFDTVCKEKEVPENIEVFDGVIEINNDGEVYLCAFLKDVGFADGTSAARRLIDGGGVSINGEKIKPGCYNISADTLSDAVIKVGKLNFVKLPTLASHK